MKRCKWVVCVNNRDGDDYSCIFNTKKEAMDFVNEYIPDMYESESIIISRFEKQFNGKKKFYCEDIR